MRRESRSRALRRARYRTWKRVFLSAAALCLSLSVLAQEEAPPNEEDVRSIVEDWRDTLLFGINSEIVDLLPTLVENGEDGLAEEVLSLFESSNDSAVLAGSARYLQEFELTGGHDRALAIIGEEDLRSDDLIVALMIYLRETGAVLTDESVTALLAISRDGRLGPSVGAVRLLASAGTDAAVLTELYDESGISEDVRGQILVELGERGDPQVFDFVREIIGEDEEATTVLQRFALDTLGKLGDPRALPIIMRQFDSSDALTRAYAVNALRQFETPEATDAIIAALRDEFWRVRVAALETIAERETTDALRAVMYKVRRDPERRVRLEAIETLAALDRAEGWRLLEERAASNRTGLDERIAIIDSLMRDRLPQSIDLVLTIMQEEWERENSRILDAIGRVASQTEDRTIEPVAARLLDHQNFILQIYGIRAAGRSRLTSLMEVVQARSEEGNHRAVRQAALAALEEF
ncbi:MAG: HEAT repeat domain-containing protein [Spirochaetales bacterium]|nr:HEAT repeat domain-containing protein [Spirochaetales bacterium]